MNLSVEISMYPLQDDYKTKIKDFLNDINAASNGIDIRTSNMSCLLYTSPSPRDKRQSRMPSSA